MTTSLIMRRTTHMTRRVIYAQKLAPDADFKDHFHMMITFAQSGHRTRHPYIDLRRLLKAYLALQDRYTPGKRLDSQVINVFGPIVGQRLISGMNFNHFTIRQLEVWADTLLHLAEPRKLGITPVSELREIEKQSTINKRELDAHERKHNLEALLEALRSKHGLVNPFKFARRLIVQRNAHIKFSRHLDRERLIIDHFGHPLVELINTDVLTSRVPLARALEEAMQELP